MRIKVTTANWSLGLERIRADAEVKSAAVVGTQRKVRLDRNTCFVGTVKSCTFEIVDHGPQIGAYALYTVTLVGPTGYEMTYQVR